MRKLLTSAALTAMAAVSIGATSVVHERAASPAMWTVDGAHSEVNFSIRHFFTPVSGSFGDFEVDLNFDAASPENSSVDVTIAVASVNTGNKKRDNHLRSGDWFEAEKYPYITFKSSSVQQVAADKLIARGQLTIKDVTQEIELPITLLGVQEIPQQMQEMLGGVTHVASFQTETELDRRDFGVGTGNWAMTAVVGADVDVQITVEANQK